MNKTLKYIVAILVLLVFGFFIRDYFLIFSFSQINNANFNKNDLIHNLSGQIYFHLLFAFSIGLIPLFYLAIKKITKIKFISNGLISCILIVSCGVLAWQCRIYQLNRLLKTLSRFNMGRGSKSEMDLLGNLNFAPYILIGFFIGAILSFLIFRKTNKNKKPVANKTS